MGTLNLSDAKELKDYWDNNTDELISNLEDYGADVSGSRTIGAYMGVSGDVLGVAGAEVQLAYAYDQETGESYVIQYSGATFGASAPIPASVQFGGFTFTGPPEGLTGWAAGVQGSSVVSTGVTVNSAGQIHAQYGVETNLAVEVTIGYGAQYYPVPPSFALQYPEFFSQIRDGLLDPQNYLNHLTPTHCFLEDSKVQMWPLDPSIKPRADGSYDEELVLSKVWYKRQDQMQVGDLVVSYDKQGRLQPGPVVRTMTNTSTHILDFWGTGVTPGHAYHCADGPIKGGFAPIMDILRMDGALMRSNGTMFRSTTNCDVDSMGDMMIHAAATMQKPDGTWTEPKPGKVRFGTRIILSDGRDTSLMELAHEEGWKVTDDGYMVGQMKGEDGAVKERAFHFPYRYGAELPKPEDYILKRSAVTLEEIYLANEWEQIGTRMPAPDGLAGFNPNSTMKRSKPKPNIPPAFANRPDAPTAQAQTQRPAHASASPSAPSMNRKQRKAMEAKQRKAAKTRKKLAS